MTIDLEIAISYPETSSTVLLDRFYIKIEQDAPPPDEDEDAWWQAVEAAAAVVRAMIAERYAVSEGIQR
jgi:hypothetical protein